MDQGNQVVTKAAAAGGLIVLVVAVAFLCLRSPDHPEEQVSSSTQGHSHPSVDDRAARVVGLLELDPELDEEAAAALTLESDRILEDLAARDVRNPGRQLRFELDEVEVGEAGLRAYHEDHRERFGGRSFEESRDAVEQLLRYRQLRQQYAQVDGHTVTSAEEAAAGSIEQTNP